MLIKVLSRFVQNLKERNQNIFTFNKVESEKFDAQTIDFIIGFQSQNFEKND